MENNMKFNNMETKTIKDIQEMITFLKEVKTEHGNIPIQREYDATYWLGCDVRILENVKNPENIFSGKEEIITVLHIS